MARILIVDDEVSIVVLLADILDDAGYETAQTYGGRDALRLFREFQPDLVITDIVMHAMDGILLIQNLRQINSTVPIIALSGQAPDKGQSYLDQALGAGANCTLQKPFRNKDLLETIEKLLSPHT